MKFLKSFKYAIEGFLHCVKRERNFRVHLIMTVIVILFAVVFDLKKYEIFALAIAIALVLVTEMINTAIERIVDHLTTEQNESAKIAKDVAAGAVFVSSIFAAIIGFVIFAPKILEVLR